jgi:trimeric autotransporter adhesin
MMGLLRDLALNLTLASPMKTPVSLALSMILAASAFLTGCSGSSSGSGGTPPPPPPSLTVTSISPTTVAAGSGPLTLTVNGTGFLSTTTIKVGGVADATTYVSATQLTTVVTAQQLASGSELSIVALNGSTSSGSGTAINLEVTNPVPTISGLTPSTLPAGAAPPTVTVTGTGYVPTTVINVNGTARATTFVSATQVSVTLTTADVAVGGSLSLTAVNATPGGGTSAGATFAVTNPPPGAEITLSPNRATTGTATPTTVTVTGTNFVSSSAVQVNGTARATTFVSSTQLTFQLTVADQATSQQIAVSVVTPPPGGGTSIAAQLLVLPVTPTPVITEVSPSQLMAGSGATTITVYGSNLYAQLGSGAYIVTSVVEWNGTPLATEGFEAGSSAGGSVLATVPASLLASVGTASITVSSMTSTPSLSNALTLAIVNSPGSTLNSISPNYGPINTTAEITLNGTGFTSGSTVALNGINIASTFVSSTQLTATIPAASVALPGNSNVTVTTPGASGGTTTPQQYTSYISLMNNDLVYNAVDGLLYASVPGSVPGNMGNSVVGIDPLTGNIIRQISVGSQPNKIALSSDGTQLFAGLDGAGSVVQVNLTTGQLVMQFSLGGGKGVYNPPYTASALAAVPGLPNSVAIFSTNGIVTIYDSGVARADNSSGFIDTYFDENYGALSFDSSGSNLYLNALPFQGIEELAVSSAGITGGKSLFSNTVNYNIQYDNGQLYLSDGIVLNATNGSQLGTFYANASQPAIGPIVSDSGLGLAFVGYAPFSSVNGQVLAFNEGTFDPTGSINVNGANVSYPNGFQKIVRWGSNGVALSTASQIYVFQSPVVQDVSSSPADLSVSLNAPATASTGGAVSYIATVKNLGPNQAQGVTLTTTLSDSFLINSVTPSQGNCGSGSGFSCDLGDLASGASATVKVTGIPSTSGTIEQSAAVNSASYDPNESNNLATASTTVSGGLYSAVPSVSAISPAIVKAGSAAFTLTITGSGFNSSSTANINGAALSTTYVSDTQLTAEIEASAVENYGWEAVTVTNPSPGGGSSQIVPLTIYSIVNVSANGIAFDPFTRKIYATLPSASTSPTGNSVIAVDPETGIVGTPINVGSEPNVMAETTDGNYLYIGLSGADRLAKFSLPKQTLVATYPLQVGTTGNVAATWLSAMPGNDNTLAIDTGNIGGSVGIFDISGSTGAFRPNFTGVYTGNYPTFADASHFYAYDNYTSGAEFYRFSVDANGATQIDDTTLEGLGGYGQSFKLENGIVYGSNGGIIDPSTTPPSQIATLSTFGSAGDGIVPDAPTNKDFLILENLAGEFGSNTLARYNTTQYVQESTLTLPSAADGGQLAYDMLRWGQDGLALRASEYNASTSSSTAQILLLRGPFVLPELLNQNSAASLASSSSATIAHGSGNTMLTLTGTNFIPGVAVTWNGNYRTTTIVDSTHVTIAIPASDLASAGSAALVATNPGATVSNSLTVTIN